MSTIRIEWLEKEWSGVVESVVRSRVKISGKLTAGMEVPVIYKRTTHQALILSIDERQLRGRATRRLKEVYHRRTETAKNAEPLPQSPARLTLTVRPTPPSPALIVGYTIHPACFDSPGHQAPQSPVFIDSPVRSAPPSPVSFDSPDHQAPASPAFLDSPVRPAPPSPARLESADQQARIIGQLQSGMATLIRQNQLLNEKVEKLLAEQRERERLSQRRDMPNLRLSGEGNVFIGSSTAGHVISREVYERAFYASNHPKDFVLKLLPAVFNDVELARSNFNGGPVFNGTTHVMKEALVQRVEFQAIIAQMVQDYPGCITERFHVELRKAVNSKCRRIAHRLRLVQIH